MSPLHFREDGSSYRTNLIPKWEAKYNRALERGAGLESLRQDVRNNIIGGDGYLEVFGKVPPKSVDISAYLISKISKLTRSIWDVVSQSRSHGQFLLPLCILYLSQVCVHQDQY